MEKLCRHKKPIEKYCAACEAERKRYKPEPEARNGKVKEYTKEEIANYVREKQQRKG